MVYELPLAIIASTRTTSGEHGLGFDLDTEDIRGKFTGLSCTVLHLQNRGFGEGIQNMS